MPQSLSQNTGLLLARYLSKLILMPVFCVIALTRANCSVEAMSRVADAMRILVNQRDRLGVATAVRPPMIATTIMSSVMVNPLSRIRMSSHLVLLSQWQSSCPSLHLRDCPVMGDG